jgi:prepilin-type N-terminal cleavage/methylation domain-containing protein
MKRCCFQKSRQGFTILELLVSAAILGIVMFVMLAAMDTGMRLWKTTQDKIVIDREARSAFSLIAEDLKSMFNPPLPVPAPVFQNPAGGDGKFMEFLVLKSPGYQSQNSSASAGNVGDVCYVRYSFRNNQILRAFADSKPTFDALQNNQFPVGDAIEEVLAINIRSVAVGTHGPNGAANTLPIQTIYYSIEASDPASLGPNAPPDRNRKFFTATASIPPP